jgi:peptidyl-prolyl cis-trans isomerase SurA
MTKHRFFTVRPLSAALVLLLALPLGAVHAQITRPSATPRLVVPAPPSASTAPREGAQRQADFIVAVVNSEPITNNEVRAKLLRTEQLLKQQGSAVPPRNQLLPQLLERMVSDKAQLQAAQASGLKIDDNAVEGAVQTVARQNQITVDELRLRLKADGIDYDQFRSEIRDELLISRLRQREVKVDVSESEIDAYLRDQQGQPGAASAAPAALNLAEILVAVPEKATPDQIASLQAKAQQVLERARAGADFAGLAIEVSASRGNGGQMGLRSADRYPPLFVEATKNLRAGELAGPVRSPAGFHILKVIEKSQGGLPDAVVAQTHARHILLRLTPQLTEAAAIEKLAGFKKRIEAGQADFATLARENSQDGSAKEGGDLGWAPAGAFVPEFEKVMNSLAPNQVSDPLVSRFGVHLLQVLERREVPVSLRDQREMVRGVVREKKQEEALVRWAEDIRGRAYVEFREVPQ